MGYYLFRNRPKITKKMALFFLNTEPYAAGNLKTLVLQHFSLDPIQIL